MSASLVPGHGAVRLSLLVSPTEKIGENSAAGMLSLAMIFSQGEGHFGHLAYPLGSLRFEPLVATNLLKKWMMPCGFEAPD